MLSYLVLARDAMGYHQVNLVACGEFSCWRSRLQRNLRHGLQQLLRSR